jgi:hypothetical protein
MKFPFEAAPDKVLAADEQPLLFGGESEMSLVA